MKVLLLTDRMDAGGAETHIAQLARGLRQSGVDVKIASGGGRLAERLEAEGIGQINLPLPTHNLFLLLGIRRRLRRLVYKEDFDILHAHARVPALLLRGCRKWKTPSGKKPVSIVTAHAHFDAHGLLPYLCHWGSFTVAVSEDLRRDLLDTYRLEAERIRVIPNGVDCALFAPPQSPHPTDAPLRVLFASRLDADCSLGAHLLCRIAPALYKDFPCLRITIAGGGSELEKLRESAETINRALGAAVIHVMGFCEDMPPLLREQDLFVGVSRCAMEAAACAKAVILCGNEGYCGILSAQTVKEALLSNLCGRGFPLPTEEALAHDLRLLLSNPALCRARGEECRRLAKTHFSAEGMCRSTLALYHRLLPAPVRARLVIGGYFGCGNLGDDAILLGFLEELHHMAPDIRVIALTDSPRKNRRRFGIPCVNRKNPLAILWAFFRSDAFLCGGGSLLQNLTSRRSLVYYLGLLKQADTMGCLPILYAAGIGPLLGDSARHRVQRVLQSAPYISLRDADSKKELQALGIDPARLFEGADPALFMPLAGAERALSILSEHEIPPRESFLCVVLRETEEKDLLLRLLPAALRIFCKRHGLTPLFLSFDRSADTPLLCRAAHAAEGRVICLREAADAVSLFSVSALVLSMRLHALIFAAMAGSPGIGIPADTRDQKIPSFCNQVGFDWISPEELTVGNLVAHLESLLATGSSLRPIFSDSVAEMRKKARKDLANILGMIYNRDKNT